MKFRQGTLWAASMAAAADRLLVSNAIAVSSGISGQGSALPEAARA